MCFFNLFRTKRNVQQETFPLRLSKLYQWSKQWVRKSAAEVTQLSLPWMRQGRFQHQKDVPPQYHIIIVVGTVAFKFNILLDQALAGATDIIYVVFSG